MRTLAVVVIGIGILVGLIVLSSRDLSGDGADTPRSIPMIALTPSFPLNATPPGVPDQSPVGVVRIEQDDAQVGPDLPVTPSLDFGVTVLVLDADFATPVNGADVYYATAADGEQEFEPPSLTPVESERWARTHGLRFRTNERGLVRVPQSGAPARVIVRNREKSCRAVIPAIGSTRVSVLVRPPVSIAVAASGPQGEPAPGIPLLISAETGRGWEPISIAATRATDSTAHFDNVSMLRALAPFTRVSVRPAYSPRSEPGVMASVADFMAERKRLHLPPTASVSVKLRMPDGAPVGVQGRVGLDVIGPNDPSTSFLRETPAFHRATNADGDVTFEGVALGARLAIRATTSETTAAEVIVAGPTEAGSRIQVDVATGPRIPRVRARLVTEQREPVASQVVTVVARTESASGRASAEYTAHSDSAGRLSLLLRDLTIADVTTLHLSLGTLATGRTARQSVSLPRSGPDGSFELGDVILAPIPLIASGIVTDDAGTPVADASIGAHLEQVAADAAIRRPSEWYLPKDATAISAPDGTFTLYALLPPKPLGLVVSTSTYRAAEPVRITPGVRGIRLVIPRPGNLTGRVVAPAGWLPSEFLVQFARKGAGPAPRAGGSTNVMERVGPDGRFALNKMAPGSGVVFLVHENSRSEALVRLDDVVVASGDAGPDPRLATLTVPGSSMLITARARGERGEPIPGTAVTVEADGRPGHHRLESQGSASSGEVHLAFAERSPRTLTIRAPGHRAVTVKDVQADVTVTLTDGIPITVHVANLPPLSMASCTYQVRANDVVTHELASAVLDDSGSAALKIPHPGRQDLQLFVVDAVAGAQPCGPPMRIDVADVAGPQAFEAMLAPANLTAITGAVELFRRASAK